MDDQFASSHSGPNHPGSGHAGSGQFAAGRDFIRREGRLLERRLFATLFEGAPATGVIDAVRGFRNDDGGLGHGLEPDVRCPASLPIYVEVGLQALVAAKAFDQELVIGACDYLADVAAKANCGGAVPPAFPVIEGYPRAAHWTEWTYEPGLNPTAGLVGLLMELGVEHPWVEEATAYCWAQLDLPELPLEAHLLREVFVFLEQVPDQRRSAAAAAKVVQSLAKASSWNEDPDAEGYGLTPLSIAPMADSRWRTLFTEEVLDAHLDRLQRDQQPDGGWPITWEPPSKAGVLEWRGMVTLGALRTLVSYGRIGEPAREAAASVN